ncbi:uncharacterized protein [Ptychodera flava]|uniref:uncharacterized protein isoform X2 n=1 Tax=Ptychodera flava TaxID=63121 RepID=UPI00396A5DAC
MSSRDGVLTSPSDPSSQGQDGGVQEIFTVDVHEPPEVKNVTDKIEQKREDAKKFAEGLSLSDDLPYHINHDISKRLKQNNDYLMLASYVGVNPVGVKAMDKPEEVLGYMSTSMEGKRDVARLIDELLKIPRYDIIDEVLVKWLFEEKEKRQSQMHENTDQK